MSRRQIIDTKSSAPLARRRNAIIITSLVVVAILIIAAIGYANRVSQSATVANNTASISVGQKAPDFSVSTTDGPFTLSKAGGKPTLLEVFASWCPHCQREVKVIDPLYAAYRDKVNFVAVNGDARGIDAASPESQADVVEWKNRFGATYPVAFDPDLDVAHKYLSSTGGFPTIVLIGADGTIEAIRDGEIPPADLQSALRAAASGKKPDPKMGAKV